MNPILGIPKFGALHIVSLDDHKTIGVASIKPALQRAINDSNTGVSVDQFDITCPEHTHLGTQITLNGFEHHETRKIEHAIMYRLAEELQAKVLRV